MLDSTQRDAEAETAPCSGLLRRPLCLITSTLGDAALLQHFVHLTRMREAEWLQVPVADLSDRFSRPESTIRGGLGRLEEKGFLSSRHPPGSAKSYRLERRAILEALDDCGRVMTEKALMGADELGYTCRGPSNDETSPTVPLHRNLCAITSTLLQAALLRQLAYLTNTRGEERWVQVEADYLSYPFDVAPETIRTHLRELEDDGLISSRRPHSDEAKFYRLERDAILEAIRRETSETADSAETEPPREMEGRGARDTRMGAATSSTGGARDSRAHRRDYNQTREKEDTESVVAEDDQTCSSKGARDPHPPTTDTSSDSSKPEQSPTELEQFVLERLAPWSIDLDDVRHLLDTLRVFGLTDRDICQYVAERRSDFLSRDHRPSKAEALRYLTNRDDLVHRGYVQPIEPVQRRQRRNTRRDETETRDADSNPSASSQPDSTSNEENGSNRPNTEERSDDMEEFLEQCRKHLRDYEVDEYIKGVLLFDGLQENIVQFETDQPFQCHKAHNHYLETIEEAAREVWTEADGVELLFDGVPIEE